ncbi:hypothetical protein Rsub_02977 [Raphidocelis subcapitata]|uniref:HTTM-like domain-containing protein n=1 Tax=Raphidocelis subcapitata TaxID=307507 RepID=A0A2V0NSN0_9CHLO|nr:hypothetical protein Rsub_02977 [Raphidocelis subcapitata]|eukprot:GBF90678.1 hypothetical protein Rsub_02977 [Raphidocelis subcapitata]
MVGPAPPKALWTLGGALDPHQHGIKQLLLRSAGAAARPVPAGLLLGAFRVLFAAAAAVRVARWWRLPAELQATYLVVPSPGWGWMHPLAPWQASATCALALAAAVLVAAGAMTWLACSTLLLLCCSLAAADGEPGSQLTSLLLQLGVAICLMPLGASFSLDAALGRSLRAARRQRRRGVQDPPLLDGGEPAQAVPLWSLLLLRGLLTKPYVQDAAAKIADARAFLSRAQPVAARLAAATRGVPVAAPLPWAVAWTSCLLDLAVPVLLLHRPTRYSFGYPCLAVAQLLNWQVLGLDGWWLLLLGAWLAWAPPELVGAAALRLRATVAQALGPLKAQPWGKGLQLHAVAAADAGGSSIGSGSGGDGGGAVLQGRAWSSWFWEGAAPQRRLQPQQQQQQQQQQEGQEGDLQSLLISPTSSRATSRSASRSGDAAGGVSHSVVRVCLVAALCLWHVATPLCFLTAPSRPAWTEEGLLAPWHRHLADKQGWIYFLLEEQQRPADPARSSADAGLGGAGRVLDVAPGADPMLSRRAVALVETDPAAALRYAARLAGVADAAGRPLASLRALSCFSLNGAPHRALFDATADLLPYARAAAAAAAAAAGMPGRGGTKPRASPLLSALGAGGGGGSGVSRWLHDYDTAPRCDRWAGPNDRPGLVRRTRGELAELQAGAGMWVEVASDGGGGLGRAVCWDGSLGGRHREAHAPHSGGAGAGAGAGDRQLCKFFAYMAPELF